MDIIDEQTGLKVPTTDERNAALFTHLAAFGSLIIPLGNIIGPMIVWLIKKDQSKFVDAHGKESLNFQITFAIAILVFIGIGVFSAISSGMNDNEGGIAISIVLAIGAIGFLSLFWLVFVIIAAVKASNGEMYRYPVSIRFIG